MRGDMPTRIGAALGGQRDFSTVALKVYGNLDNLQPLTIPHLRHFSAPELLKRWRNGGCPIPDDYQAEFQTWLESAQARTERIQENQRRLRGTLWAEVVLRGGEYDEYAAVIGEFHRTTWGVSTVPVPVDEREAVVIAVIERMKRGLVCQ